VARREDVSLRFTLRREKRGKGKKIFLKRKYTRRIVVGGE
jgi:hypothetical protein